MDFKNLSIEQLHKQFTDMAIKLEARRATCRKSSKQYYNKTFKLTDKSSPADVAKNKASLMRRDEYQKKYYQKNKETIKLKQREYREERKKKEQAEKEFEEKST